MTYNCSVCSKQYKKPRHLRLHFARQHTNKKDWVDKCLKCGKVFADSEILQRHSLTHDAEYKVICQIGDCKKEFKSTSALSKHREHAHSNRKTEANNKKQYCCEVENCNAQFFKHHVLKQHSYQHTGILPFPCSKCDKRFFTLSHKTRHEKIHNGYPCETCGTVCSNWSKLRQHRADKHKQKEFKCVECDLVFKQACRLKDHLQVHCEERSVFKCTKCDKTFVKKYNLKTHVRVVHLEEKQFPCNYAGCNKAFAYKKSLKFHSRVHEDDYVPVPKKIRSDKLNALARITGFDHQKAITPEVA